MAKGALKTIPVFDTEISADDSQAVFTTLQDGWVSTSGPQVKDFEQALAAEFSGSFTVATSSGTAALHLAYGVAGVQKGDIVLLPTLTFIASVNPLVYLSARPVFVDVDPETLNLSLASLKEAIFTLKKAGEKPKALVAVHLLGHCADMDALTAICAEEKITLVEDAAQSLGSTYKKKPLGTFGRVSATSFNGNKIVTCGGGGAVITKDKNLREIAHQLANQGKHAQERYIHDVVGFNYRMPNLNAQLGLSQLKRLPELLEKKAGIHEAYRKYFSKHDPFSLIEPSAGVRSNYWVNAVISKNPKLQIERLTDFLLEKGIETQRLYLPVHLQKPYKNSACPVSLKHSEEAHKRTLFLPSSHLLTPQQMERIFKGIDEFCAHV